MNYSKEAYQYLETEHIRLLTKESDGTERPPTINERILEAFEAGRKSLPKLFSSLDVVGSQDCKINFSR